MLTWVRRLQAALIKVGKPREVEGVLDRLLIRPGGVFIARLLRPTTVSPNAVSAAALIWGWITAFYLFQTARTGNDPYFTSMAALALYLHSALDSADGQLARWRSESTELGRLIDGVSDYLTFAAIYLAIGFGLRAAGGPMAPFAVPLAVVAGLCHALQCAVVEYQRNLFRFLVYGTELAAADSPTDNARKLQAGDGKSVPWIVHSAHLLYSRIQQGLGGSSLRLRRQVGAWMERHPDGRPRLAALIRVHNGHRLRWWALLAPNSHKVGMIVGALPIVASPLFGSAGLYAYFFYVIVLLNLLLWILIRSQTRADTASWEDLQALAPERDAGAESTA